MAVARFLDRMCLAASGFWTMALLRYAAKLDPFLSLDCARVEGMWMTENGRCDGERGRETEGEGEWMREKGGSQSKGGSAQ